MMGPYPEPIRNQALVLLQVFMGIAAVTTLAIAAEVSMRRRVESIVRDAYDGLGVQHRPQSADLAPPGDALRAEGTGPSRAEGALRESEQRFRLVTELASDGIVVCDAEGRIVSWNRGAETIFGYKEGEVMGLPIEALAPRRCRPSYGRRFDTLRESRESRAF